ncbi:MAG: OmpH family outer membrane protein [Chitinivibrionales bacterium]|nr:OmpH family outer membrane protein [Chitinivibrionales bacterium]
MARFLTLKCGIVTGILLLCTSSVMAQLKIGYINSERILAEYQGTKAAEEKLKKEYAKWEQEATERQKKMKDMKEQLDKQSLLLSAERKKEMEAELEKEYIDYNKFLQEKFGQQGDAAKKNDELLKPIVERINKILDKLAKDENYDFIFDTRGGLVYGKKQYEVSDKVIQALNSEK